MDGLPGNPKANVNTKNGTEKRLTCGPILVELDLDPGWMVCRETLELMLTPFDKRFSSKHSVKASVVVSMSSFGRKHLGMCDDMA
jgi:hypothetical protein